MRYLTVLAILWASAASAVPAAAVLALVGTGAAQAVTLTEPTMTTGGVPLSTAGNALWACTFTAGSSPSTFWLAPRSPAGGGVHFLPIPVQTAKLPWKYEAHCLNAQGWGPAKIGILDLNLTVAP